MKQITTKQLQSLALADKAEVKRWTEYSITDWIAANAQHIGWIETGRADKTLFGEWPKGWKAEMKRASAEKARLDLIEKFKRQHILEMDGALWLNNWELINELK
jgi:hypothetical protein